MAKSTASTVSTKLIADFAYEIGDHAICQNLPLLLADPISQKYELSLVKTPIVEA
jgi:hypothetical protein